MMPRRLDDRGAGLLSMALGVIVFMAFLVLAVNITYNLYATSVVSSFALDGARSVAEADGKTPAQAVADFHSAAGNEAVYDIVIDGDIVRATLSFETSSILPGLSTASFGKVERTFEVRVEEQQP